MFDERFRQALQARFDQSSEPVRMTMFAEAFCLILQALTYQEATPEPEVEPQPEPEPEPTPEPEPEPTPEPGPLPEPVQDPPTDTDLVQISDITQAEAQQLVKVGIGSLQALAKWTQPVRMQWNEVVTPENIERWRKEAQRILEAAQRQ